MTRQETGLIMDILTAAYPRFYANQSKAEMIKAVNLWSSMFCEYDVKLVAAAVKSFIAGDEKGFPPHIGAIMAKIRLLTEPDEMTELEAWSFVAKALRNSVYESREEFEKLPPVVQRLVHSPSQLREWALMPSEEVHTVVASNFQRSYKQIVAREKEFAALPSDVKTLLSDSVFSKAPEPSLPVHERREIAAFLKGEKCGETPK